MSDGDLDALRRVRYVASTGPVAALGGGTFADVPLSIYVHGTPGDAKGWAGYLADVPGGGEALAIDRPGFGASEPRRAVRSLADQAAAIAPLLGDEGDPAVVLIGHSLGAPIAAWVATEFPERVAGLALIAGSMAPELERRRWFNYVAAFFWLVLPRAIRNSNDEVWRFKEQLELLEARLDRVTCPVLIVHGERDGLVPVENADFSAEKLSGSSSIEVVRYDDAGHLLIWNRFDDVHAVLDRWIRGL